MDWAAMVQWIAPWMGWVVGVPGALLVVWGLWGDSLRGGWRARRCAKCWYDMGGLPGLICPECGRDAKDEGDLHHSRRRKRLCALGLLLVVLGAGASAPTVQRDGWRALLPTTVIIAMLPPAGEEHARADRWSHGEENGFAQEMRRRVDDHRLSSWQWRWAIHRTRVLQIPRRWPVDEPLMLSIVQPSWLDSSVHASIDDAPDRTKGKGRVNVRVSMVRRMGWICGTGLGASWTGEIRLPVRWTAADEAVLTAERRRDVHAAALRAIKVSVWAPEWSLKPDETPPVRIEVDARGERALRRVALGASVELWCDDQLLGTTRFEPKLVRQGRKHVRLAALAGGEAAMWGGDLSGFTLRIRGDERASRVYLDCRRYWAGEFEVGLEEVVKR